MNPLTQKSNLSSGFPQVWGELAFQSRFLRHIALLALAASVLSLAISETLIRKKPLVIALDRCGDIAAQGATVPREAEIEKAARRYAALRYAWDADTLGSNIAQAHAFVAPQSTKAFEKTLRELLSFAKGKRVRQRIYPTSVAVNEKEGHVTLTADRFTEIQGLNAATLLSVILTIQSGPRTEVNPWGIYIVKEEEIEASR